MASPALADGEGNLAVAHAALFTQQYLHHADLIRAFLRNENVRMAITAIQPLGVLFVGIHHVGHAALHLAHNVEVEDKTFGPRIGQLKTRPDLVRFQRLDPVDMIPGLSGV